MEIKSILNFNESRNNSTKTRIRFRSKGILNNYWSVEENSQELYQIKYNKIGFQLFLNNSPIIECHFNNDDDDLPNFYFLNQFNVNNNNNNNQLNNLFYSNQYKKNSLLLKDISPFELINLNKISLQKNVTNHFIIKSNKEELNYQFKIETSPGHYLWKAWDIYNFNTFDKDSLAQFIWFGKERGKPIIGGIEFFTEVPVWIQLSFILVTAAYFVQCRKECDNNNSSSEEYKPIKQGSSGLKQERLKIRKPISLPEKFFAGLRLMRK